MFIEWSIPQIILCYYVFLGYLVTSYNKYGQLQDQTSPRTNTLFDDADDIQKQLENEARDRVNYGRPKTIFVFHLPTRYPIATSTEPYFVHWDFHLRKRDLSTKTTDADKDPKDDLMIGTWAYRYPVFPNYKLMESLPQDYSTDMWSYEDQKTWSSNYPQCAGRFQSPVNLPSKGLIKAKSHVLQFAFYNELPLSMVLQNDGNRVILTGEWSRLHRPLVYGGAAYNRRYLFHSLVLHWPSEHSVGNLQYPIESQLLHISAEYKDFNEAIERSPSDPLAFLGIVNIYKFANETDPGIANLLSCGVQMGIGNATLLPRPLSFFSPPFKRYACYQGSLTTPPCTESVLWIVRRQALKVNRNDFQVPYGICNDLGEPQVRPFRLVNPLNDRSVYLF